MVAQMVDMAQNITCSARPTEGCAAWLPRIRALSMVISIFAHFSHDKAKMLAGGNEPNMPEHFVRLLKLVESVFKPVYKTEGDFMKQLSRLSVHIEFNMSMPSISVEDACGAGSHNPGTSGRCHASHLLLANLEFRGSSHACLQARAL